MSRILIFNVPLRTPVAITQPKNETIIPNIRN